MRNAGTVMNTIPLIFNERQVNRVVLGGKEAQPEVKINLALIILNTRGSQFRDSVLKNLSQMGFEQIVSIETSADNYSLEDFVHKFPYIKFIAPLEPATEGELLNIGMSEIKTDYVLVIKDTLSLTGDFITSGIAEKITALKKFAVFPRLLSQGGEAFPIVFSPGVSGSTFKINSSASAVDGLPSLYPFDNIAVYNRKKFIQLGGFDYTISSPHWQTVDFFMRAWLWGEKVELSTLFFMTYSSAFPLEDVSADLSYGRFYMKNLLPKFDDDHGVIPKSSLLVYLFRSGCGLMESFRQFFDARSWVNKNKYRFTLDAKYLVENWGKI